MLLGLLFFGCAQTRNYTPAIVPTNVILDGLPFDLFEVQINDFRIENKSDGLKDVLKKQISNALSRETVSNARTKYYLIIDIIEHKSFFTLGNWHGSSRFGFRIIDSENNSLGSWNVAGDSHRSNMWGYKTANDVGNDSYNIALAEM